MMVVGSGSATSIRLIRRPNSSLGINDRDFVYEHLSCVATFPRCGSNDQAIGCGQRGLGTVIRLCKLLTGHVFSF